VRVSRGLGLQRGVADRGSGGTYDRSWILIVIGACIFYDRMVLHVMRREPRDLAGCVVSREG